MANAGLMARSHEKVNLSLQCAGRYCTARWTPSSSGPTLQLLHQPAHTYMAPRRSAACTVIHWPLVIDQRLRNDTQPTVIAHSNDVLIARKLHNRHEAEDGCFYCMLI